MCGLPHGTDKMDCRLRYAMQPYMLASRRIKDDKAKALSIHNRQQPRTRYKSAMANRLRSPRTASNESHEHKRSGSRVAFNGERSAQAVAG